MSLMGGGGPRQSKRVTPGDDNSRRDVHGSDEDGDFRDDPGFVLAAALDRNAWHDRALEFLAEGGARVDTGRQPGLLVRNYIEQQELKRTLLSTSKDSWEARTIGFLLAGNAWVGNGTAEGVRLHTYLEKHDPELLLAGEEAAAEAALAKDLPSLPDALAEGDKAGATNARPGSSGGVGRWNKLSAVARVTRRVSRERRVSGESQESNEEAAPGDAPVTGGVFRRSTRASREQGAVAPS